MGRDESKFKESITSSFHVIVEKNRFMRIPALIVFGFLLFVHGMWFRFINGGWKKYAFASFLLINILIGASFAYPVFGDWDGSGSGGLIATDEDEITNNTTTITPVIGQVHDTVTIKSSLFPMESTIELAAETTVLDSTEIVPEEFLSSVDDSEYLVLESEQYSLADLLATHELIVDRYISNGGAGATGDGFTGFYADDWRLILVNKQRPLPSDYEFTLGTISGSMMCEERIIDDLLRMMQGASEAGVNLVIISAYRDFDHQLYLFTRNIDRFMRRGFSYIEAFRRTSRSVTIPGSSEHQAGLAIDILSSEYRVFNVGFADTKAGKWLNEHSHEYGFILRYPREKEYITGIDFEPWHFRYVGREAAQVMKEEGLTLEEFWDKHVK
ncbi:MAG: M15 family metallopeptidase [Lachnospiraceae bacterium]|jgi:D-alanyl-D-alanine carboxypeptidase|nr:M15 family metallopeptidase [Lachnospiraceae bacterium]